MGIPLFERRTGLCLFDSLNQHTESSTEYAAIPNENNPNSVLDAEQKTQHVANERMDEDVSAGEERAQKKIELIDETHDLIQQILSVLAVSNTAELGLIWQVHDSETISLNDNILITPKAVALANATSKQQLWKTLQSHFKAKEWS